MKNIRDDPTACGFANQRGKTIGLDEFAKPQAAARYKMTGNA